MQIKNVAKARRQGTKCDCKSVSCINCKMQVWSTIFAVLWFDNQCVGVMGRG